MGNSKLLLQFTMGTLALCLSACGEKKEPPLPKSTPQSHANKRAQGYDINGSVAVDRDNNFHHMQRLVSDYYNYDLNLPPASIRHVAPSCNGRKSTAEETVHVVIARNGGVREGLRKEELPSLMLITNLVVDEIAKDRAAKYIKTGTFNGVGQKYKNWPQKMNRKEVVITESKNPVYVVLVTRWPTLYNFTLAPNVKVSGVMVYSDARQSAVAGLDPSTPVRFLTGDNPATKKCWVRPENKPDSTWTGYKKAKRLKRSQFGSSRYHLLNDVYKKFAAKIKSDVGRFSDSNLISVHGGAYFLIGPEPRTLEERIKYSPVAGSHIIVTESDDVQLGLKKDLENYAYEIIHTKTKQLLTEEK